MTKLLPLLLVLGSCAISFAQDDDDSRSPRRVAVSQDGRFICAVNKDKNVRVWSSEKGTLLHKIEIDRPASCVAISAKGDILVAATIGSRATASIIHSNLYAWSIAGDKITLLWSAKQLGPSTSIALDPKGKWCATSSSYGTVNFYDLKTGDLKRKLLELGHGLVDLIVSSDGVRVLTAGDQLTVWEPDAKTFPEKALDFDAKVTVEDSKTYIKARNESWTTVMAIAPEEQWAVAFGSFESREGRADALVRVDLATGKKIQTLGKNMKGVTCLNVSTKGAFVAIGYDTSKVQILSVDGKTEPRLFDLGDFGAVRSLAFFDDGKRIVVVNQHGTKVEIFSTIDGKKLQELSLDR